MKTWNDFSETRMAYWESLWLPIVQANIAEGWPQLNDFDLVVKLYPEFRTELEQAADDLLLTELSPDAVKRFCELYKRPCLKCRERWRKLMEAKVEASSVVSEGEDISGANPHGESVQQKEQLKLWVEQDNR